MPFQKLGSEKPSTVPAMMMRDGRLSRVEPGEKAERHADHDRKAHRQQDELEGRR